MCIRDRPITIMSVAEELWITMVIQSSSATDMMVIGLSLIHIF